MNPFLEQRWGDFHTRLLNHASNALADRLPEGLLARMEERIYIETEPRRVARPDVYVYEERVSPPPAGGAAVAEAGSAMLVIQVPADEITEAHLNIVDARSGGKIITSIEFLSPGNKFTGPGRDFYLRKQNDFTRGGVNLVEIDLIRSGEPTTLARPDWVPHSHRAPYHASVYRAAKSNQLEYYSIQLKAKLPSILVPLRAGDADAPLDLQALVEECFFEGRYYDIDYAESLDPPLSSGDAEWVAEVVRGAG